MSDPAPTFDKAEIVVRFSTGAGRVDSRSVLVTREELMQDALENYTLAYEAAEEGTMVPPEEFIEEYDPEFERAVFAQALSLAAKPMTVRGERNGQFYIVPATNILLVEVNTNADTPGIRPIITL